MDTTNTINLIIRKEEPADYLSTERMTMRAFWNLQAPGCNEHYLVHLLRESLDYLPELSRIAEIDGQIVGAIFYTKAKVTDGVSAHPVVTFGPLAVDPLYQGLGIGSRLLKETISLVRKAGYPGIIIFGEPDYYPRLGFVTCDHFQITDQSGQNFSAFMAYETTKGSLSQIKGKFIESEVFEKACDEQATEEYNHNLPDYPKYKVPSQWLHEQKLGKISFEDNGVFRIAYWEKELPAILNNSFVGEKPLCGDLVTFDYRAKGYCLIRTVEKEIKE